ncbi:MAG: translocation/assembly module TamB domain-containing protein [Roseivirga sp.]
MLKRFVKYRFLRILIRLVLGLLLFLSSVVLFIRSPWGQDIIVTQAVNYISGKTGTQVAIDKLYLTFSGNLSLKGLYLEDQRQDTLIYSESLEVSVALAPLIRGNNVNVKGVSWSGLKANVERPDPKAAFNYEFLIEAFASPAKGDTVMTTDEPGPEIRLGKVKLRDFHLQYADALSGMTASANLGSLDFLMEELDLDNMRFVVDELKVADSEFNYKQSKAIMASKPAAGDGNTEKSALPWLAVNDFSLNSVSLFYQSVPDKTTASIDVGEMKVVLPEADLSKQRLVLEEFVFSNSKLFVKQLPLGEAVATDSVAGEDVAVFAWPDWRVEARKLSLQNNELIYQATDSTPQPGLFDPERLGLSAMDFVVSDISLRPGSLNLNLDRLAFKERSGFQLKELSLGLGIDERETQIKNLKLTTEANKLAGQTTLSYASIQDLIDSPDSSFLALQLDTLILKPSEFSLFSEELEANEYVQFLTQKSLTGKVNLRGNLEQIDVEYMAFQWGKETSLRLSALIDYPMDTAMLKANLSQLRVKTTRADLKKVMGEADPGLSLPRRIALAGSVAGGLHQGLADLSLNTTDGAVSLKGEFTDKGTMSFKAQLTVKDLLLGKLLENEQLDTLGLKVNIKGSGSSLNDLNAQLQTSFSKLKYDGYDFSALTLDGDIKNGEGALDLSFKDQNLDMLLNSKVYLDSVSPKVNALLTVKGADLYELGLMDESIRTAFTLEADFEGNTSDLKFSTSVRDGVAVYQRESYSFGSFNLNASASKDTLHASVNSSVLDASIHANQNFDELLPALQSQIEGYLHGNEVPEAGIRPDTRLRVNMALRQAPILSEVFLQGLERLDTVSFQLNFDAKSQSLEARLMAPYILYQGSTIDSVKLNLNGRGNTLDFLAGWSAINSGPVSIDHTVLAGQVKNSVIDSEFTVFDKAERLLNIGSQVSLEGDTIRAHLKEKDLIFNKKNWSVLPENQIQLASRHIDVEDFEISNGIQKVTLSDQLPTEKRQHIGAVFENFQISSLTSFLNPDEPVAAGMLKGQVIIENPFDNYGLVAGLSIEDLEALQIPLGTLTLDARAAGVDKYEMELGLNGENAHLDLSGSYLASASGADLTLDLDLKDLQMSLLEQLSDDNISQAKGSISGSVDLSGKSNDPQYSGTLAFNEVSFLVNQLNSQFAINNDKLKINNSGLFLDDFIITDGEANDFRLDGKILTDDLKNPVFDLSVVAGNFSLLNSDKQDNDFFYGQVKMDADLTITGDLNVPKVRGEIKVNDGSNLTIIVPESELELKARDGVVLFVNRKNPDDILTRVNQNEASAMAASLAGYDIETVLKIGKDSQFNIIIDEATGDNLRVQGTGDFSLGLEPNGRTSLSGKYELSAGHFETNLYNLVQRRFEIAPGSSISWLGDPLDADLDVRAIYNIETSAGPLMADRTSSNADIEAAYRQKLPFEVYINVAGELLNPTISFNLDMPEDDRGALGGSVYTQIERLNSQEEELNKQVFSLLVLGNFFSSTGSDGSSGGPASLALDNVSRVLEGQLNNYSDKLFGKTGLELGFDLNNTTNVAGKTETQLGITAKKQFFKDRLIIQVGSEVDVAGGQSSSQGTPIIGNVSVEYLLTRDRRLRLQGFNRNVYEGVIDGQLTVSGIAFIFSREFNKFKELWVRQVQEETKKRKKSRKKK